MKPVLTHLKESDPSEEVGTAAKEAVDRYMNTLDVSCVPVLGAGAGWGRLGRQARRGPRAAGSGGGLHLAGPVHLCCAGWPTSRR